MFKRIGALLGFWPLVWYQNSVTTYLLKAKRDPWGKWEASAMFLPTVRLLETGQAPRLGETPDSVRIWVEWKHNRKHVTFED